MFLRRENDNDAARQRIADTDRQIELLTGAIGSSGAPGNARHCLDLAAIHCWHGRFQKTQELLTPLLQPTYPSDISLEARQLIADNQFRHDQYDLANRTYHENLVAARECGNEYWIARARDGIAWVLIDVGHFTTGEFSEASKVFEETLPLHRKHGMWVPEAMDIYGLSRAAAGNGDYNRSAELAQESIEKLQEHGGSRLLQFPLLQLANVYRDSGNFDKALPYYDQAIDAADDSQDPYMQVLVAYHYGCLLKWTKRKDEAREIWQSVLSIPADLDFPRLGSELCRGLAQLAEQRSNFEEAYRLQIDSQNYGNRVGVISHILQNQQMLLREAIHRTGQLEAQLSHLTAGVEASDDGIFVFGPPVSGVADESFLIQFVNEAGADMLGRKPYEIMHVLLNSVWKSPTSAKVVETSRNVYVSGHRQALDPVELEFRDGRRRWYAVRIAKIDDGIAWTVTDVTEREAMRRQIEAQRDRLTETNARLTAVDREKSEMLGIAAHDLRSPIGNIRSLCDFIPKDDAKTSELVSIVESSADALLVLIANLLDVERIERGEVTLNVRSMQVEPLIRRVAEEFYAVAAKKQIRVATWMADPGISVRADEGALLRILQNLVSNAVKFSPTGSQVEIRACACQYRIRFEIKDDGPGISDGDMKRLFRKFGRLSARPTGGESSSGLGLSIVKHLVEAMSGYVGCDSEIGAGSTFWFEIPRSTYEDT
ncbi:MAG: ATP-binding protein [Fimbriimonas sp.]|nr:ATP-binding protein [Fimbriimonas sp.]